MIVIFISKIEQVFECFIYRYLTFFPKLWSLVRFNTMKYHHSSNKHLHILYILFFSSGKYPTTIPTYIFVWNVHAEKLYYTNILTSFQHIQTLHNLMSITSSHHLFGNNLYRFWISHIMLGLRKNVYNNNRYRVYCVC